MTWLGVLMAVLASMGFACAAVLQHGAVRRNDGGPLVRGLLADRRWLLGLACLLGAATLHGVALALAPLTVVQPIGVLGLLASTAFAIRSARRAPRFAELLAVGLAVAGVCGFVLLTAPVAESGPVNMFAGLRAAGLVAAGVVIAVVVALRAKGSSRCAGFAFAGAACYALVSVMTRVALVQLRTDGFSLKVLVLAAAGVVAALAGGWLIQHAYAAGSAELVMGCQTVGDPAVAVGIGAGVLGEAVSVPGIALAGLVGCALAAVAGIVVLARDRAQHTVFRGAPLSSARSTPSVSCGTPAPGRLSRAQEASHGTPPVHSGQFDSVGPATVAEPLAKVG